MTIAALNLQGELQFALGNVSCEGESAMKIFLTATVTPRLVVAAWLEGPPDCKRIGAVATAINVALGLL